VKYYKLMTDFSSNEDVVCTIADLQGIQKFDVLKGKPAVHWNENVTFEYNAADGSVLTDYLANDMGWFLVSEAFKTAIQQTAEGQVEFLPVKLVETQTRQTVIYYVVNVTKVVDALDLDHSDHTFFEANNIRVLSVKKYTLLEGAIGDANIFKLLGDEIPVFVSESVRNRIEESKLTGCKFLEVGIHR